MYVITDHNNGNFVILGPIEWKPRYISDILYDELDEEIQVTKEDKERVPYEIAPGIKVRKCQTIFEELNTKIHRHEGPFWEYDDENMDIQATATWKRTDKKLEIVKSEQKTVVAELRWKKENIGIKLTIQETEVWCDTSRDGRDIFLQKYLLMGDEEAIRWKFPQDIWLTLSKSELGYIVQEGALYIQSCFDWESDWASIIDNCSTLEELDDLKYIEEEQSDG